MKQHTTRTRNLKSTSAELETTRPTIVFLDPLFRDEIEEVLQDRYRLVFAPDKKKAARELSAADAAVVLLSHRVNQDFLDQAPRLRAVGCYSVGTENVDFKECEKRGIRVVHTPNVLTHATAQLALTLLLSVARRVPEGEALCRSGQFKGWKPQLLLGNDLRGQLAVIVGPGRIGTETARLFSALGLTVEFIHRGTSEKEILRLLSICRAVSLHLPYSSANHHWLGSQRLAALSRQAVVINTARGALIDEQALARALKRGEIFGAGLDVFEHEPKISMTLRKLKNVVLLPHVGSATPETRKEMTRLVCRGVDAILSGHTPPNEVSLKKK